MFILRKIVVAEAEYLVFPSFATVTENEGVILQVVGPSKPPLKECLVRGAGSSLVLSPETPDNEGIRYWGNGLDQGDCGVQITSFSSSHEGSWQFFLTLSNGTTQTATADLKKSGKLNGIFHCYEFFTHTSRLVKNVSLGSAATRRKLKVSEIRSC